MECMDLMGNCTSTLSCRKKTVIVFQLGNMDTARSVDLLLLSHLAMRQIAPHFLMVFPRQRKQIWTQPCGRIIVPLLRSQMAILVNKY